MQQLSPESKIENVDEGQVVVTSVLAELEQLRAEQHSSFELMAGKAEALASAQAVKGGVEAGPSVPPDMLPALEGYQAVLAA